MSKKGTRKTNKKQRRKSPARVDILAAAFYWVVKTILLIVDWFTR